MMGIGCGWQRVFDYVRTRFGKETFLHDKLNNISGIMYDNC